MKDLTMNYLKTIACALFSASLTFAYTENCMPDLPVPTQLDAGSLEADIQHRFLRIPGPDFPDNFINMANVNLGLRYVPLPKVELGTSYDIMYKEYDFRAGYSFFFPREFLRMQALATYYGAKRDFYTKWDHSFLGQINFQGEPLADRVLPVVDLAYDGLSQRFGIGTGLDIVVWDNIDLLGEYYPVLGNRDTLVPGGKPAVNCFAAAVKFTTLGHHFMLTVSNNYELGMRRHMRGAADNTIYYGFNIHRVFSL
jgi:hypothetical protein